MKSSLRIAFLTAEDPRNRKSWSGIHYRMLHALEQRFQVVHVLGPAPTVSLTRSILMVRLGLASVFHLLLYRKKYNRDHSRIRSAFYSRFFKKRMARIDVDVIFAPSASIEIALLDTGAPICYLTGSTFAQIHDYYDFFSGFSDRSVKESNEIERSAITRSRTQVFPSTWAADFACEFYNAGDAYVVKHGANLDVSPDRPITYYEPGETLQILFIGVDWVRKGGDLVLRTVELLLDRGLDVEFTVCGCVPPDRHPKMTVIPFLDKNKAQDRVSFHQLLQRSHLFFMPTRAENFGVVFCEANAFGLPAIATRTGGTTSAIEDGVNGYTLPLQATPADFADLIQPLVLDDKRFARLADSSKKKYLEELNWDHWGERMKHILEHTAAQN